MAKRKKRSSSSFPKHLIGSWSFLVGVVLAVLLGLGYKSSFSGAMVWIVFLVGVIVGLLNVTHDEAAAFLTSGTILVLVSFLGVEIGVFKFLAPEIAGILKSILILFVPATIIVALKSVFSLARG